MGININCGGLAFSGYLTDQYFTGGSKINRVATAPNVLLPPFDTCRATSSTTPGATFTYAIPATDGPHRLQLWFIETGVVSVGQRKMNIDVNGNPWIANLDVRAEAENYVPVLKETDTYAVGGYVTVKFTTVTYGAFVSALMLDNGLTDLQKIYNLLLQQNPILERIAHGLNT